MDEQSAMAARRPQSFAAAANDNGLGAWARLFLRFTGPRLIFALLLSAVAARIAVAEFRRLDLVVAVAVVAAQPFTEWLLHVFVLHFKPRPLGSRTLDLYIARKHREHHVDPLDIGLTLVQLPALLGLIGFYCVAILAGFRNLPLALSALIVGYSLLLVYEWMHFLIHSTYVPRHRLYKSIWRAHRLHHFKNEHYWFGVTNPLGDIWLRTYPDRSTVVTSHTARTLGQT